MIAYIKGQIMEITPDNLVMEVNQIGYNIRISAKMAGLLPAPGQESKIYTYTYVKEDALQLYGFLTKDDLEIFKLCITVNGIGPKGALAILSVMDATELRFAILAGNAKAIAKAPGIGSKTAERLILDLKDKVKAEDVLGEESESGILIDSAVNGQKKEAAEALTALGYTASEAAKAVNSLTVTADMTSDVILKQALKLLF